MKVQKIQYILALSGLLLLTMLLYLYYEPPKKVFPLDYRASSNSKTDKDASSASSGDSSQQATIQKPDTLTVINTVASTVATPSASESNNTQQVTKPDSGKPFSPVQPPQFEDDDPIALANRIFVRRVQERLKSDDSFKDYYAIHRHQLEAVDAKEKGGKFVVFRCDNNVFLCGGLGDRINGLISAFYLALLLDRAILVRWTKGITWTHFVRPSDINWHIHEEKIQPFPYTDVNAIDNYDSILSLLSTEDMSSKLAEFNVIFVSSNVMWADVMLDNPHLQENVKRYHLRELNEQGLLVQAALRCLIKPTSLVEGVLEHFAITLMDQGRQLNSLFFISLQVRTGGDGEWADRSMVPQDKVPVFADAAIQMAKTVPSNDTADPKLSPIFFVSSDSLRAVTTLRDRLKENNYDTVTLDGLAGPVTHMDRSGDIGTIERNLRTWSDWFMLMAVDKSVLSRSGFGESASSIICKPAVHFGPPYKYTIETVTQLPHGFCTKYSEQRERALSHLKSW